MQPGPKIANKPVRYEKRYYRCRSRIEIMFGWLKDWRRVATRHDRCPTASFPPLLSPPLLSSGCDQRVPTLAVLHIADFGCIMMEQAATHVAALQNLKSILQRRALTNNLV